MLRIIMALVLGAAHWPASAAEHRPLIPQPREVRYGTGHIPLRSLTIQLPAGAAAEDIFAAQTLSACLGAPVGTTISISVGQNPPGRAIVLKRTGVVGALALPGEQPGPDSREAYEITVRPDAIELHASSTAGLFYGAQTMCQLVEGADGSGVLPEVEIRDWPSLAYRGTMVDMSHGPLPAEDELKRQLDFMARWKLNQYYFYNEASVELKGHPLLNPNGRFTQDEVRRIVAYGRERHIDVIPCLELYGHLHDLFRVEKYSGLADVPHGTEFDPRNP